MIRPTSRDKTKARNLFLRGARYFLRVMGGTRDERRSLMQMARKIPRSQKALP